MRAGLLSARLPERVSQAIRLLADTPPRELRELAHQISAQLIEGDLAVLPDGIAILAMLDGGWWFNGLHYHAGCPRHGTTKGKTCHRAGVLRPTETDKNMPNPPTPPAPEPLPRIPARPPSNNPSKPGR